MISMISCNLKNPENSTAGLYPSFSDSSIELIDLNGADTYPGETIRIKAGITNSGATEATNVTAKLIVSDHLITDGAEVDWNIESLGIGETKNFNTDLKISRGIASDITVWGSLNIISDETGPFTTPEHNLLVSGVKQFERNHIPIIGLHAIEDEIETPIEVYTSNFDILCRTLQIYGFETITFTDLLNYIDHGKALPEKPVIITSDDGFGDLYINAFPILKKYGYTMTVFLVTGYTGDSDEDRKVNSFDIDRQVPMRPMLIWPEIQEMHEYGIEFLSHSVNHIRLGSASDEEFIDELTRSKNDIESHLGTRVLFFAWPYDNNSPSKWHLIPEAGYRGAVRYWGGIEDLRNIDLYDIKRIEFNSYIPPGTYPIYLDLLDIVFENEYGQHLKKAGEEFTFKYTIKNNDHQNIHISSIELELPDNIEFMGTEPGGYIDQGPGLSEGIYMWVDDYYDIEYRGEIDLVIRLKAISPGESIIKFRVTVYDSYFKGDDAVIEIE